MHRELIELTPHRNGVKEMLLWRYNRKAKILQPQRTSSLEGACDVLVVQHGLEGTAWRGMMESKAGAYLADTSRQCAVVFDLAPGLKIDTKTLNLKDQSDIDRVPKMPAQETFSMGQYMHQLARVIIKVRELMHEGAHLHIAGHSYGALATLYALETLKSIDAEPPTSVSFLSPFVRTSLDQPRKGPWQEESTPNTRLSIGNWPGKKPEEVLREVLEECRATYKVPDEMDLLEEHRKATRRDALIRILEAELGNYLEKSNVQLFVGMEDPYIKEPHGELLMELLGRRMATKKLNDGHSLESIEIDALIQRRGSPR